MLKGTDLGAALEKAMKLKKVSQADVARHFKVQPPSVHEWRKFGRIGKDHIDGLIDYFSDVVGPEHWGIKKSITSFATAANDSDYEHVSGWVRRGGAGKGKETVHHHGDPEKTLAFQREYFIKRRLNSKTLRIGKVDGPSMSPKFEDGDTFVYDTAQVNIVNKQVYALEDESGLRIKRLVKSATEGMIDIVSDNKDLDEKTGLPLFPTETVSADEIKRQIIGRLIWHCGDL